MEHVTDQHYYRYTSPQRLDKAMHTLEGLLKGIAIDGSINPEEMRFLKQWCDENKELVNLHPFNEIIPWLEDCIFSKHLGMEIKKDLEWLVHNWTVDNMYFDKLTTDIQRELFKIRERNPWLALSDNMLSLKVPEREPEFEYLEPLIELFLACLDRLEEMSPVSTEIK